MAEDIGESLVGAYLRYVQGCEFVLFNTFLPGVQGEIDVIGIRLGRPQDIYFVEVTTHIQGMTYGGNSRTVEKVREKLVRAQAFAKQRFPTDRHHFQIWSPKVPEGAMTVAFEQMRAEFAERGEDLSFVINRAYGDRLQELVAVASVDSSATSDPAYRLLQILARVKSSDGPIRF